MVRIRWIPARLVLVTAALLSVAVVGSVLAPPAAFADTDNRTPVPIGSRNASPLSAVVRLEVGSGDNVKGCTGSIIDADSVLTAAHCLVNKDVGLLRLPQNIKVFYGGGDGTYTAKERSCIARWRYIAPEYPGLFGPSFGNTDYDYGVVNVGCWRQSPGKPAGVGTYDGKFPKALGRFQLSATPDVPGNLNGRMVQTAGFPSDKGFRTMYRASGAVAQASARTFTANLAGAGGQSGSAVWGSVGGCVNCVVGVLSYGTRGKVVTNPTSFVRINQKARDRIRSWAAGHLLVAVDCTGSMGSHRDALITRVGELMDNTPQGTKVAAVCWGDPAEPQVLQAFTTDTAKIKQAFAGASFGGGGDTPEDPLGALAGAPGSYGTGDSGIGPWNRNTSADVLLVTDAPGKDPSPSGLTGPQVVEILLAGPTNTYSDGDFGSATADPVPAPPAADPVPAPPAVDPIDPPAIPDPNVDPTETYPAPDVLPQPLITSVAAVTQEKYIVDQYTALAEPTGGTAVGGSATEVLAQILQTIAGLPVGAATTGWVADLSVNEDYRYWPNQLFMIPPPAPVEVSSAAVVVTPGQCPTEGGLPASLAYAVTLKAPATDPAKVSWFWSSGNSANTTGMTIMKGAAGPDGQVQAVATFGDVNRIVLCWPGTMFPFEQAWIDEVARGLRVVVKP